MATSRRPVCTRAPEGAVTCTPWGDVVREVVPANLTTGAFSTLLVDACPDAERPGYVHHAADEAFVVLSGTVGFDVGGEQHADLGPGDAVFVPRGVRRAYRTGPEGARLLVTQTPGWSMAAPRGLLASTAGPDADPVRQHAAAMAGCGIEVLALPVGA